MAYSPQKRPAEHPIAANTKKLEAAQNNTPSVRMIFSAIPRLYRHRKRSPPPRPQPGPKACEKHQANQKQTDSFRVLLSAFRAARPRRKQRSTKTSGILFDRMSALPRATSVPFSRLARGLELMTIMVQPLQIRKRMIIARHDVVTVITYPVAQRRMHARLAMIMRALANHGTDGGPVPGQPSPPVAPIPSTHARPRSTTTPAPWPI